MQPAQTWHVIRPTTEVIHVLRIIGRLQKRRQVMQKAQTWRVIGPTTEVIHVLRIIKLDVCRREGK